MRSRGERTASSEINVYRMKVRIRVRTVVGICIVGALVGCARSGVPGSSPDVMPAAEGVSVWAMDLVQTRPGYQEEYLRGIAANWAGARQLALAQGDVRSYRAFVTTPDSARGWDVVLLTEYTDSSAFARRETTFQKLFADPRYVAGRVVSEVPSRELRTIVESAVLTSVAGGTR